MEGVDKCACIASRNGTLTFECVNLEHKFFRRGCRGDSTLFILLGKGRRARVLQFGCLLRNWFGRWGKS